MTTAHRYQIVAPLARGGMGEILLARRLGPAGFEKLVVLKRPLHTAGSRALVTALIDEARLLARISHPNVCEIYDLEQAGDQFFFTMEYLEGLSMWSMLGEVPGGIEPRILCGLFEQACDGLGAIHTMRTTDGGCIVHRDVSPGNLFVTERGVVKVLDLGIAKSTDAEERTPFGRIKGKLGYLSPEQAAGQPIDHRSDLFSLGLVLHDMVSGRLPKRDRIGVLAAAAIDFTAVPRPLADVIQRAIAPEVDDRFASAAEMATALREAGAAFGGSYSAREIAAWLADQFGPELARRRAIAAGPGDATRTQIWVLRSASAEPDDDEVALAAPAEPPAPPSHETERLAVPTRERLRSSPGERRMAAADQPLTSAPDELTQPEAARLPPASDEPPTPPTTDERTQVEGRRLPTPAGELVMPPTGVLRASRSRARRGAAIAGAGAALAIAIGVSVALLVPDGAAGAASPTAAATTAVPATDPPPTIPPPPPAAPPSPRPAPAVAPASEATPPAAEPAATPSTDSVAAPAAREATAPRPAVSSTDAPAEDAAPPSRATEAPPGATATAPHHKPHRPPEPAAPGLLTIDSQPFAVIHLGNRNLGTTPLWRIPLPAGRHEFRATTADGRYQDIEFRITPGRERKVMLDWSRP